MQQTIVWKLGTIVSGGGRWRDRGATFADPLTHLSNSIWYLVTPQFTAQLLRSRHMHDKFRRAHRLVLHTLAKRRNKFYYLIHKSNKKRPTELDLTKDSKYFRSFLHYKKGHIGIPEKTADSLNKCIC